MATKLLDRTPTWQALIIAANTGCGFIMLERKQFTLVDEQVMADLEGFNWRSQKDYVAKSVKCHGVIYRMYLHQALIEVPEGMEVDHRNRMPLDNRRENLRVGTHGHNIANNPIRSNKLSSQYKGVRPHRRKWKARGNDNGKDVLIGMFFTEEEVARAYDRWAFARWGEFAHLNFPDLLLRGEFRP